MEAAVVSSNEFNLKLLGAYRSHRQRGNVLYSLLGITTALTVLYRGAMAETRKEIGDVLCIRENDPTHQKFCSLLNSLRKLSSGAVLNIASIVAADKSFKILQEYSRDLKENYNVDCREFDFGYSAEAARNELNQFTESVTNGKIKGLFNNDSINLRTKLVSANAIYFKGTWMYKFPSRATQRKPFYTITDGGVTVDMMRKKDSYKHFESTDLKATFLEIPYSGNRLSMTVILPNAKDGLTFLENSITPDKIKHALENTYTTEVYLSFPKFKLEESFPLKECLSCIGMKEAFTREADFSGIGDLRELSLSAALHKSSVEVNEEGTETATGIMIAYCSYIPPFHFTVDRPFMFFIREVDSGLILFTGSVHSL